MQGCVVGSPLAFLRVYTPSQRLDHNDAQSK